MRDTAPWTANAVLGDGETVSIRPITPADAPRLAAFHRRQSDESKYRRYFTPKPTLSARELEHFTNVDLVDRAALVVESHDELLGWASYERWPGRDDADTAFMVDDAHHGKGIATLLLEHLAAMAAANGIERFTAEVLGDEPADAVRVRTRRLAAAAPLRQRRDRGRLPDRRDPRVRRLDEPARAARRQPRHRPHAVPPLDRRHRRDGPPRVRRRRRLWRNVTRGGQGAACTPSTTRARTSAARPASARVTDIPADVSLAVIAVPAAALAATIDDCIAARVRGAVVMTSVDGSARRRSRAGGQGAQQRDAHHRPVEHGRGSRRRRRSASTRRCCRNASSPAASPSRCSRARSAPPSSNWRANAASACRGSCPSATAADVSGTDLLQFFEDDEATKVVGMYTEDLGNPRRFARIARRVSQRRPIVAVRTSADLGPTNSALYQHCGLIEVPTVTALLDTVRVLATQPVLAGDRIAVLSNYPQPAPSRRDGARRQRAAIGARRRSPSTSGRPRRTTPSPSTLRCAPTTSTD